MNNAQTKPVFKRNWINYSKDNFFSNLILNNIASHINVQTQWNAQLLLAPIQSFSCGPKPKAHSTTPSFIKSKINIRKKLLKLEKHSNDGHRLAEINVIAGLFFKFTIVKLRGPNKSLNLNKRYHICSINLLKTWFTYEKYCTLALYLGTL